MHWRTVTIPSRTCAIVSLVVAMSLASLVASSAPRAFASSVPQTCSYGQLDVATGSRSGAYYAAGNVGIAFYIVNISSSACSLEGFPRISFSPQSFKRRSLRVVHGGGVIFTAVKPRTIILDPGYTASFGINFGDAYNQQDPNGSTCTTKTANVLLPERKNPWEFGYHPDVSFNFCFAGFRVNLTPIQNGPIPKLG